MATEMIVIYAMPGSQYSGKVLAALDSRGIAHYCQFVSTNPKTRKLPSGGTLVPEMTVGTGEDQVIVKDSEQILHWLDENLNTKFFPTKEASEISVRANDKTLAGGVLYYNWVDDEGYKRSMRANLAERAVPSYIPFFRGALIDYVASGARKSFAQQAAQQMGVEESELNDEPKIRGLLLEELKYFQSFLKTAEQMFLLPGKEPTAADFSIYAQVDRLVGSMGDAKIYPSLPELKKDTPELERLWQWHGRMTEKYPFRFTGKRPPANKL